MIYTLEMVVSGYGLELEVVAGIWAWTYWCSVVGDVVISPLGLGGVDHTDPDLVLALIHRIGLVNIGRLNA